VAALVFGAIALTIPVRILYNFCTAKLIRLPGEEHSKCHIDNAKPIHSKAVGIQAKAIATAVFIFELAVALIPLNPFCYLLMLGPAAMSGFAGVQVYLKVWYLDCIRVASHAGVYPLAYEEAEGGWVSYGAMKASRTVQRKVRTQRIP
jgi:hypothetical protein